MYNAKQPVVLPTLDRLDVNPDALDNLPALQIAQDWLQSFTFAIAAEGAKPDDVLRFFQPDAWWRDILALTWDFRSFQGHARISKFLADRILSSTAGWKDITIASGEGMKTALLRLYPDLAWVQFFINFTTNEGTGVGVVRLIPTNNPKGQGITWKAFMVFTTLTELKDHPEFSGQFRNPLPNHGFWPGKRQEEVDFKNCEPAVVVVGAGQSGLDVAARLKALGVNVLIIEKNATPGEVSESNISGPTRTDVRRFSQQWINRYEALCLHDPVWYDHMPYVCLYTPIFGNGLIACHRFPSLKHGPSSRPHRN